jgi:monoamine oxidase
MNRRNFIQGVVAFASLADLAASCNRKNNIRGGMSGASAYTGHKLRDEKFGEPVETITKDVVIAGAGISGLSAARTLHRAGIKDFMLLDLEPAVGGNAASGRNALSAYPWGAHYIPVPNNSLHEYIQFLQEANVITGMDEHGLPVYNEYHLCFDPQDRLYINGRWQEGLVPAFGVPADDLKQAAHFLKLMDDFRHAVGSDGREAFAIPVNDSSKDEAFVKLDRITMKAWMEQEGFTSSYLHWYINYCTRDDFGTTHDKAGAWAGIHYFASRKGKGSNAEHSDLLTWPEGNGYLVQHLQKGIQNNIQTGALVVAVKAAEDGVSIHYFDVATRQLKAVNAKQCILALPQFIACRLMNDTERSVMVRQHLHYVPWMVANITVGALEERSGPPLSWDNVIYNSQSLGYVESTHQLLSSAQTKRNLTYYMPLTGETPMVERKRALEKTYGQWVGEILADLKVIHPNIEEAVEEINVKLWGHAMVQPLPHLVHGPVRKALGESIRNRIHFAHTDLAGISIFEEAFYQGLQAAKKVLSHLS